MYKNLFNNILDENKIDKENTNEINKLVEKIKLIDDFVFDVDKVDVSDDLSDDGVNINVKNAFTEDEIEEYSNLQNKFAEKLKELNFIIKMYESQKKVANDTFNLPLSIKIKFLINDISDKINSEKKAILGVNKIINSKEKDFVSKVDDFNSVLTTMRIENNIDAKKLTSIFGEEFINNLKINLIAKDLIDFLKEHKIDFNSLVENNNYLKETTSKYPEIVKVVSKNVGANI